MTNKVAFVDAAGGSGSDAMTLAWAHPDGEKNVLDGVVEKKPPFSPQACVKEFAEILKRQGITSVTGDRYSGGTFSEMFRNCGIRYEFSTRTKNEIYAAFLVLANSGQVQIPLHRKLISQLQRLERRVRGARESIDHPPGGHDDLSNAACGALVLAAEASGKRTAPIATVITVSHGAYVNPNGNLADPFNDYGFNRHRGPSFGGGGRGGPSFGGSRR
jgi:hypothetical protein